jgi:putative peptide zinc metalloprotease protein
MVPADTPIAPDEYEHRLALLTELHVLASLPVESLVPLVAGFREERFAAGAVVASEMTGRRYVIVSGAAEVAAPGESGPVPLATLEPGELFGEAAFLEMGSDRHVVITAQTDLHLISFDGETFEDLVFAEPMALEAFAWIAGHRMTARFLKLATPFAALPPQQARALAMKIRRETYAAGAAVFNQGDEGDTAYLVITGRLDATRRRDSGEEQRLSTMRPGMMFGETALLNGAPRNATVVARQTSEVLVLSRSDIFQAMTTVSDIRARMVELLQMRALPQQTDGIQVHERPTPEGQIIRILKDPARGRYYQLSPQGWFLWQRLDGQHTIRDLSLEYLYEYKSFSPQAVAEVLGGLAAGGFIKTPEIAAEIYDHVPPWQRALLALRRVATWQTSIHGLDPRLTRWYDRGVWVFYTRPMQVALALIIVSGIAAFVSGAPRMREAVDTIGPSLFLVLIPCYVVSVVLHELGHAFAVKAFGREVHRAGVGWLWYAPIAFVDTSDMWLSGRWPRVAVDLAGLHVNLILAGVSAAAAWMTPDLFWSAVFWQWALASYWMVAVNLNPLLEFDGYYVLSDWLDIPNLRRRAMTWLGHDLVPALRTRTGFKGHALELTYGLASVLYIVAMAVMTVVIYRYTLEAWIANVLPPWIAAGLAWFAALIVVLSAGSLLYSELRQPKRASSA